MANVFDRISSNICIVQVARTRGVEKPNVNALLNFGHGMLVSSAYG